jgi:hypothetical protein
MQIFLNLESNLWPLLFGESYSIIPDPLANRET